MVEILVVSFVLRLGESMELILLARLVQILVEEVV